MGRILLRHTWKVLPAVTGQASRLGWILPRVAYVSRPDRGPASVADSVSAAAGDRERKGINRPLDAAGFKAR